MSESLNFAYDLLVASEFSLSVNSFLFVAWLTTASSRLAISLNRLIMNIFDSAWITCNSSILAYLDSLSVASSRARFSCFSRSLASTFSNFFWETVVISLTGLMNVRSDKLKSADVAWSNKTAEDSFISTGVESFFGSSDDPFWLIIHSLYSWQNKIKTRMKCTTRRTFSFDHKQIDKVQWLLVVLPRYVPALRESAVAHRQPLEIRRSLIYLFPEYLWKMNQYESQGKIYWSDSKPTSDIS